MRVWNIFVTFALLKITEIFYIMKYGKFISELSEKGCYLVRQGANHAIWYSPITKRKFPMPRHGTNKEVPMPLEKKIRSQAGI